ncbi:MAG: SDR family NAD(P)-dependent oxidoreductase [Armatimonadota bacterium]
MQRLKGRVAIVTGASRGGGRGIARVLGEEGATVYVTGRTSREGARGADGTGTIEETAEWVSAAGGVGIPVRCDHTTDAEVEALFCRVREEQGRLDLLVNNVWGGYEGYAEVSFTAPFWEQPLWRWDRMFAAGVRAHFSALRLAAPLMIIQGRGLVVHTTFWDRSKYLSNLPYDVAKAAVNRLAHGAAVELRPHGIAVVALSPGWMRTEAVLRHLGATEETWQSVPELASTESPQYLGRAVAALAGDPRVLEKSGCTLTVGDLAQEYGFSDVDGRVIPAFRIPIREEPLPRS